jgi:hypothetical protein
VRRAGVYPQLPADRPIPAAAALDYSGAILRLRTMSLFPDLAAIAADAAFRRLVTRGIGETQWQTFST